MTTTVLTEVVSASVTSSTPGNIAVPVTKIIHQLGKSVHFMLRRSLHVNQSLSMASYVPSVSSNSVRRAIDTILKHRYLSKSLELQLATYLFSVAMRELAETTATGDSINGVGTDGSRLDSANHMFILKVTNSGGSDNQSHIHTATLHQHHQGNPWARTEKITLSLHPLINANVLSYLRQHYDPHSSLPLYLPMVSTPAPWSDSSDSSGSGSGGYHYIPTNQYMKLRQYHPQQTVSYPTQSRTATLDVAGLANSSNNERRSFWKRLVGQTPVQASEPTVPTNSNAFDRSSSNGFDGHSNRVVRGGSPLLLEALDFISSVPWKVDGSMLGVIKALTETKISVPVSAVSPVPNTLLRRLLSGNINSTKTIKNKSNTNTNTNINANSNVIPISVSRALSVANIFTTSGDNTWSNHTAAGSISQSLSESQPWIYFPHLVDFRGRVYSQPEGLNHMTGGDVSRALLRFAKKRPLGRSGFNQLKLHLANLFDSSSLHTAGVRTATDIGASSSAPSKLSNAQKLAFVDRHWQDVLTCARDPFGFGSDSMKANVTSAGVGALLPWWMSARQPFQALATCIELTKAVDFQRQQSISSIGGTATDSQFWEAAGRFSEFKSDLPVHVDGNCNGLQHYAAMNRCVDEGMAVNLLSKSDYLRRYGGTVGKAPGSGVTDKLLSTARVFDNPYSNTNAVDIDRNADDKDVRMETDAAVPVDVYNGILKLLLRRLRADGSSATSDTQWLSQKLVNLTVGRGEVICGNSYVRESLLTRSVIKKTVMTHVSYGLSFDGAVRQLQRMLRQRLAEATLLPPGSSCEHAPNSTNTTCGGDISGEEELKQLSTHLATVLIGCIEDKFKTTRNAMRYLSKCAASIAAQSRQIYWHTPVVGMTVVQPIGTVKVPALSLIDPTAGVHVQKPGSLGDSDRNRYDDAHVGLPRGGTVPSLVSTRRLPSLPYYQHQHARKHTQSKRKYKYSASVQRKQASAFPPNFLHSLDGAHLMLTALRMKHYRDDGDNDSSCSSSEIRNNDLSKDEGLQGLSFASVHDSYWTHAGDIPVLSRLLREAFIELHTSGGDTGGITGAGAAHQQHNYKAHYNSQHGDCCHKYNRTVLQDLEEQFAVAYPFTKASTSVFGGHSIPSVGKLDLDCVLNSTYFFQ